MNGGFPGCSNEAASRLLHERARDAQARRIPVQGETTTPPVLGLSEGTETDKQLELVRKLKALREARGHEQ